MNRSECPRPAPAERPLPLSNDRMLARWKELRFPDSMTLRQSGPGYLSIRWPEGGKLRGAKA